MTAMVALALAFKTVQTPMKTAFALVQALRMCYSGGDNARSLFALGYCLQAETHLWRWISHGGCDIP